MADNIVARDLMLRDIERIDGERSLAEAMRTLVELQEDPARANALAVVDAEDRYDGLLTARLLLRSMLALWMPSKSLRDDPAVLHKELLDAVADRTHLHVHDALIRGLPTAAPDDRLLTLIEYGCDQKLEFVPVVDSGELLGLVPVTEIFQATAGLALTPEHEGIRMDRPKGGHSL